MIKLLNQKYTTESGITFKVWYQDGKVKNVRLKTSENYREFIFDKSSPEMVGKIGKTFIEISEFIKTL